MKPMPGGNRVLKNAQGLRGYGRAPIAPQRAAELLRRARRARRMWIGSLLIAAGATATVFQSCSGAPGARTANHDGKALVAGKDASVAKGKVSSKAAAADRTKPIDDDANVEKAAKNLETLLAKLNSDEQIQGDRPESSEPDVGSERSPAAAAAKPAGGNGSDWSNRTPVASGSRGSGGANVGASLDGPGEADHAPKAGKSPVGPPKETKSVAERRAELTSELASLLRPAAADGSDSLEALAPLLALETVQPGAATVEIEAAIKTLTPDEAAAVRSVRDLLRRLGAEPALATDAKGLSRELAAHMDQLATQAPTEGLILGTVAMCSRVESFGRYSPLPSSRMIAGKINSAIIYAEVQNFVQRPAHEAPADAASAESDGLVVQLSEEIELWHDDGTRQWRAPVAVIRDSSKTRRHDFFLVQRVDLPANLSVGKYNLKVTVRDAGAEGAPQAEATIPIEIIADPRLVMAAGGPGALEPSKRADTPGSKPNKISDSRRDVVPPATAVNRPVPAPRPVSRGK